MNRTRTTVVRRISRPNCRMPRSNSVSGGRVAEPRGDIAERVRGPVAMNQRRVRAAHDRRAEEHAASDASDRLAARLGTSASCRPASIRRSASPADERSATRAAARRREPGRRPTAGRRRPARRSRSGISLPRAVAQHGRRRRHRGAQALRRLLRAIRLPEVDRDAEQHDRDDDRARRCARRETPRSRSRPAE